MNAQRIAAGGFAPFLSTPWRVWTGLGGAVFVLAAVALEVAAGSFANSPVPRWAAALAPVAWPMPLRVLWWLVVAAAALSYRLSMAALGLRQHRSVTFVTVVPFVAFAGGVAVGTDWATWH